MAAATCFSQPRSKVGQQSKRVACATPPPQKPANGKQAVKITTFVTLHLPDRKMSAQSAQVTFACE
ncbi:hypothetical protein AB0D54_15070 [Streptomyces xanthophaeus]|uniref:hypothetical protein n=1 Tax=Streptomyces xanthophaeus TaxID=67385 RepID=UPI0034350421